MTDFVLTHVLTLVGIGALVAIADVVEMLQKLVG